MASQFCFPLNQRHLGMPETQLTPWSLASWLQLLSVCCHRWYSDIHSIVPIYNLQINCGFFSKHRGLRHWFDCWAPKDVMEAKPLRHWGRRVQVIVFGQIKILLTQGGGAQAHLLTAARINKKLFVVAFSQVVKLCVCVSSWQNMVLVTPIVVGTSHRSCFEYFASYLVMTTEQWCQ